MDKWSLLFLAGFFEIFWAVCLKYSAGFSKILPSVLVVIGSLASFYFLSLAIKKIPLSVAYAVWTGIGIAGTSMFGVVVLHEAVSLPKILFVIMIICGIIGLRLVGD